MDLRELLLIRRLLLNVSPAFLSFNFSASNSESSWSILCGANPVHKPIKMVTHTTKTSALTAMLRVPVPAIEFSIATNALAIFSTKLLDEIQQEFHRPRCELHSELPQPNTDSSPFVNTCASADHLHEHTSLNCKIQCKKDSGHALLLQHSFTKSFNIKSQFAPIEQEAWRACLCAPSQLLYMLLQIPALRSFEQQWVSV